VVERSWSDIVNPQARIDEGDFVVMPNHVHGVVWIEEDTSVGARHHAVELDRMNASLAGGDSSSLPRLGASPLRSDGSSPIAMCSAGSLGVIVGSFKSSAARRLNNIRRTPGEPVWQRSFYEHIIRDQDDLRRVREYILDNPRKWAEDLDNPANLG